MGLYIPQWVPAWIDDKPWVAPDDAKKEFLLWMQTSPDRVQEWMRTYPPFSVLWWPCASHFEHFGIVTAYNQAEESCAKCPIYIRDHPAEVSRSLLDIEEAGTVIQVGYHRNWTPDFVDDVLKGKVKL